MAAMGCKGGKTGGKRRTVTMTPEERREVAQKAAKTRWSRNSKPSAKVMTTFGDAKPRAGASEARKRANETSRSVERLFDKKNEEEFIEGLEKDFGISSADPRYGRILATWQALRSRA